SLSSARRSESVPRSQGGALLSAPPAAQPGRGSAAAAFLALRRVRQRPRAPVCRSPELPARAGRGHRGGAEATQRPTAAGAGHWPCSAKRSEHVARSPPLGAQITSEKLCRAQHELHFQAATYLCLLRSVREHLALHQEYHAKGERSTEEAAGLVGLKLPQQPGGKGWDP
uniref:Protein FMC1 homolog n=1 Tax=Gopherus evgoodei TaxID=1825980 RepID=A0A8C4VIC5_9SAUR